MQSKLLRRILSLGGALGLAVVIGLAPAPEAQAQSCPGANTVRSAAVSLIEAAHSGSPQAFAAVVDRYANVSRLAMFALGPYRRAMPEALRGEYVRLTRQFIGNVLASRAGSFVGGEFRIVACGSDGGYNYVESAAGGRRVVWRLRGGQIADVNVEGVWLAPQLRSNFVSVIRRSNGDIGALIQYLRSNRFAQL